MAIDNANDRKSIAAILRFWRPPIIDIDGSIGREDRAVIGRSYFGIVPNESFNELGLQVTILASISGVDTQTMQETGKLVTVLAQISGNDDQTMIETGKLVTVLVQVTGTDELIEAGTVKATPLTAILR